MTTSSCSVFPVKSLGGLAALVFLLGGCASNSVRTSPPPPDARISDPFEPVNRVTYRINDGLDRVVIGPAASLYKTVIPKFGRDRVRDFTENLNTPIWLINEVLQGDWKDADVAFGRFLMNSTVGLGGLFDPAESLGGLEYQKEDFGQTLAVYGVPKGPYLVLPLAGPLSFRDVTGRAGNFAIAPMTWVNFDGDEEFRTSTGVLGALDTRARVAPAMERVRDAADPYANLRALYVQSRQAAVHEDADPYGDLPEFE